MSSINTENNTLNFSSKQAGELEEECETYVMKIEREKINYRLCEERYQKHLNTYNILSGKDSAMNKNKDKDNKVISNKEKFNKKINDGKDLNSIKNTGKLKNKIIIFFSSYFLPIKEKIDRDHDLYANESEKVNNIFIIFISLY